MIPRIIPPNPDQRLSMMLMTLMSWSRHIPASADSLILFPGFAGPGRIGDAITLYREIPQFNKIVVGGIHPDFFGGRCGYGDLTCDKLIAEPYGFSQSDQIRCQNVAYHTQDQADWIAQQCYGLHVEVAVIMACPFHLPRAYVSTLSSMKHLRQEHQIPEDRQIALIPYAPKVPATIGLSEFDGASPEELMTGELVRIRSYQQSGYLLSDDEIRQYFTWMELQDLM